MVALVLNETVGSCLHGPEKVGNFAEQFCYFNLVRDKIHNTSRPGDFEVQAITVKQG